MSKEDATKILDGLNEYVKDTTSNAQQALAALVAAGLVKESGQPEEPYKT